MALPSEKKSGPDSGPSTSFHHPALPRPRRPWVLLAPAPPLPPCRSIGQEQPQQCRALAAVAARAAFKMTVAVEPNIHVLSTPNHGRGQAESCIRRSTTRDRRSIRTSGAGTRRAWRPCISSGPPSVLAFHRVRLCCCATLSAHTCVLRLTAPPCERCWAAWIATTTRTANAR